MAAGDRIICVSFGSCYLVQVHLDRIASNVLRLNSNIVIGMFTFILRYMTFFLLPLLNGSSAYNSTRFTAAQL